MPTPGSHRARRSSRWRLPTGGHATSFLRATTVLLAVSLRAVPSAGEPPAEAMAERMLAAIGGRAAWAGLTNSVNDSQQNRAAEAVVTRTVITMDYTRPRFRIETTGPGLHLIRVVDGERGWRLTRDGRIELLPPALLAEDLSWYAANVYRTLHRVAARDPALTLEIGADERLEVRENNRRLAWFRLDARGEPYAFGAHEDDEGSLSGPWEFVAGDVRLPVWVSTRDGSFRAMVKAEATNVVLDDQQFAAGPIDAPGECDPRGLRPLVAAGNVLLIGEIHGGVEAPALIGALACAAARRGLSLTLALELPVEEAQRIGRFLASGGAAADREALLAGEFWRRVYQDGRSSVAMLQLLADLRELRASGASLRVALLDTAAPFASDQGRDDFLGGRLVAAVEAESPDGIVVALAGNIHTRTAPGVPWNPAFRPAGIAVEQRWPERTVSLLLAGPPGETWICSTGEPSSCGVARLGGKTGGTPGAVELYGEIREGYEGEVRLPTTTASPPAVRP